jgi:hypothetical protein
MAPFEALYGRRCRTPLNWSQAGEREVFGPDLVLEAEDKVRVIKKNLEASQARQKSYHDKRRKPLRFEVGDHVYLKVSPTKGVQRFGIKGMLAPHYIGPYEIKEALLGRRQRRHPSLEAFAVVAGPTETKRSGTPFA